MSLHAALLTDLVLVDRCKDGEQAATRELFRQYQRRVHATLYRILGSNHDIDDLMQESFIQVFRSLHNFRGEAKLSTWIDRVTVRVAYRYIAKKPKTPVPVAELEVEASEPGPSQQVFSREGVRRLYQALGKLPAASRIAFALHEIDGRSVAEVAEIVGAAKSTTKLRIWRARRSLFKLAANDPFLADLLSDVDLGELQ